MINNNIGTVNSNPSVIPIEAYLPMKYPIPAPPTIVPNRFAPNIKPLILPNSSGLKISTARPSTATSCRDAKQLWKNNKPIIFGKAIAKIIISEKSKTEPKLTVEPTTTKNISKILYVNSLDLL